MIVTRAELQALHDPPRTTVETTRRKPGAGSQLCAKIGGAACVLGGVMTGGIAPLLFWLTDDPPYDEIVVRSGDDTRYVASLDLDGRFMNALDRRGTEARQIGVVDIPKLATFAIVERGRGPLAKPGSKEADGPFVPTPLLPQFDVAAVCNPHIPKFADGAERGELVAQCASAMAGEAAPFLTTTFASSSVATKASSLTYLCHRRASPAARDIALEQLAPPEPQVARVGAACRRAGLQTLPYLRAIAAEACTAGPAELPELLGLIDRREQQIADVVKALPSIAPTCADPVRTVLLASVLTETKNPATLAGALSTDDPGVPAFVPLLDTSERMVRKGMLMAITLSPHAPTIATALARVAYHPPDEQLLVGLAFAKNPRLEVRATLLPKLGAVGFASSGLRPVTEAEAKAASGSDEKVALRVGLLVAGRREHAANVASSLSGYEGDTSGEGSKALATANIAALVAQGLSLSGCEDAQIAALTKEPKVPDTKRGPLCTKPR